METVLSYNIMTLYEELVVLGFGFGRSRRERVNGKKIGIIDIVVVCCIRRMDGIESRGDG